MTFADVHHLSRSRPSTPFADIPKTVAWLRKNDDYARAVALAGRARMSTLDVGELTNFMAEVLTTYAERQVRPPAFHALLHPSMPFHGGGPRYVCAGWQLWLQSLPP